MVDVDSDLRKELEHWKFIDSWQGALLWRPEFHKTIDMATDSSQFRYGAVVKLGNSEINLGDYWPEGDNRPIHLKEADAVLKSLQSLDVSLRNSRVDVSVDNMAVISVWGNHGGRDTRLNSIIKEIFNCVVTLNMDLHMKFVPSSLNLADGESRILNASDTMLSSKSWLEVESIYGPHSVDLMALDSNTMTLSDGTPLRHFTPTFSPLSSGVNVFCQTLESESNPYVFPPYGMIFPILCFLEQQHVECTVVVPQIRPLPIWWPMINNAGMISHI
ncbi:hypothetical protein SNE40_014216 [Patella caerulea]